VAQPVITDRSVIALHIGILLRFTGLNVIDADALFLCPRDELVADVLRTVVAANSLWLTPPLDELLERADHSVCRQRKVRIDD